MKTAANKITIFFSLFIFILFICNVSFGQTTPSPGNTSPVCDITYAPSQPAIIDTMIFNANETDPDGSVVEWMWDFGDGHTANSQIPTHRYADDGNYTVTCTITDNNGSVSVCSITVTVTLEPIPPQLSRPDLFHVELYSDLGSLGVPKAFGLYITSGEQGFPAGLYVTSGPASDDRGDRLLRVSGPGQVEVVKAGFHSNFQMVFAKGPYGQGILISEPLTQRILRLLPDGDMSIFAEGFTPPFGPSGLVYGPDGILYVADQSGGNIVRIDPYGSASLFTSVPLEGSWGPTSIVADPSKRYGSTFIAATFSVESINPGASAIYSIPASGDGIASLAGGLTGVELLALAPGGVFGTDLYIPTKGGEATADGAIYTMSPSGELTIFMTGLDAISVVFDTEDILGGGMFVADLREQMNHPAMIMKSAGRIWRILPREAEICDGKDNDYDGLIDEDFDVGEACTAGVGICKKKGTKVCTADGIGTECSAKPGKPAKREVCGNGKDDDCDGKTDEGCKPAWPVVPTIGGGLPIGYLGGFTGSYIGGLSVFTGRYTDVFSGVLPGGFSRGSLGGTFGGLSSGYLGGFTGGYIGGLLGGFTGRYPVAFPGLFQTGYPGTYPFGFSGGLPGGFTTIGGFNLIPPAPSIGTK